jgi:hypothetical protein
MFKNLKGLLILVLVITLFTLPLLSNVSRADSGVLGSILKTFGIGAVVDRFAEPINNFINTLTLNNGVEVEEQTKVVPIVTVGSNTYAGAVQVSGPKEKVQKVEAVAQLEGDFQDGAFRIRALVPVNTKNPADFKNIDRIEGVGVTALIDINI